MDTLNLTVIVDIISSSSSSSWKSSSSSSRVLQSGMRCCDTACLRVLESCSMARHELFDMTRNGASDIDDVYII